METPITDALREALEASSQESSSSSMSPSPSPSSSSSTNYPSGSSPSNHFSELENMNLSCSPSISRSLHHNQPIMNPPPTPTTPTPPAYPTEDSQSTCSDSPSSNSSSTSSSSSMTSEGQESTATITVEEAEKKFTAVEISAKPKTWKEHFNSLPPRTRQTVRTLAIALVSGLALVAIFHLARLAEHPTNTNELDGEVAKVSSEVGRDSQISSSVFKAENGKAIEYKGSDKNPSRNQYRNPIEEHRHRLGSSTVIHPILGVPVPANEHLKNMPLQRLERRRNRPANATDIQETLQMVRKKVESDRKLLSKKELQLWSTGEVPLRVMLVTTWRSGSTFLGQVLAAHPGVFQHYEPLSFKGVRQIRSGRDAFETQQLLHRLLECRYEGLDEYLKYSKKYPEDMMSHNKPVWWACKQGPNANSCFNESFLNQACNMFPIQLVKTVRLRLNLTQLFLNDHKMNVKVIFLVRDPRAVMSSRYNSVGWCKNSTDCSSPEILCQDLQGDLKVATAFKKLYPDRFSMIKYENLAQDPQKEIQKLMEFLGMEYTSNIDQFVQEHTAVDVDQPWSTKRKSSDRISLWKKQLPLEEVFAIQNVCESPIKTLLYEMMGQ